MPESSASEQHLEVEESDKLVTLTSEHLWDVEVSDMPVSFPSEEHLEVGVSAVPESLASEQHLVEKVSAALLSLSAEEHWEAVVLLVLEQHWEVSPWQQLGEYFCNGCELEASDDEFKFFNLLHNCSTTSKRLSSVQGSL